MIDVYLKAKAEVYNKDIDLNIFANTFGLMVWKSTDKLRNDIKTYASSWVTTDVMRKALGLIGDSPTRPIKVTLPLQIPFISTYGLLELEADYDDLDVKRCFVASCKVEVEVLEANTIMFEVSDDILNYCVIDHVPEDEPFVLFNNDKLEYGDVMVNVDGDIKLFTKAKWEKAVTNNLIKL